VPSGTLSGGVGLGRVGETGPHYRPLVETLSWPLNNQTIPSTGVRPVVKHVLSRSHGVDPKFGQSLLSCLHADAQNVISTIQDKKLPRWLFSIVSFAFAGKSNIEPVALRFPCPVRERDPCTTRDDYAQIVLPLREYVMAFLGSAPYCPALSS
jgi:hypothetical protein